MGIYEKKYKLIFKLYNELKDDTQELVERAIPMKVKKDGCPNCNDEYQFENSKFCDNCGQALDWTD